MQLEVVLRADYQFAEDELDAPSYACNNALRELQAIARCDMSEPLIFNGLAPRAARHLASALEQAPGRGEPEWEAAWATIEGRKRERAEADAGGSAAAVA